MDMREKIARVLATARWREQIDEFGSPDSWEGALSAYDRANNGERFMFNEAADAVLEAMRTPTEGMVSDGAFQIFRGERITDEDLDAARRVWRGMISRAARTKESV